MSFTVTLGDSMLAALVALFIYSFIVSSKQKEFNKQKNAKGIHPKYLTTPYVMLTSSQTQFTISAILAFTIIDIVFNHFAHNTHPRLLGVILTSTFCIAFFVYGYRYYNSK